MMSPGCGWPLHGHHHSSGKQNISTTHCQLGRTVSDSPTHLGFVFVPCQQKKKICQDFDAAPLSLVLCPICLEPSYDLQNNPNIWTDQLHPNLSKISKIKVIPNKNYIFLKVLDSLLNKKSQRIELTLINSVSRALSYRKMKGIKFYIDQEEFITLQQSSYCTYWNFQMRFSAFQEFNLNVCGSAWKLPFPYTSQIVKILKTGGFFPFFITC